jgi:hypothetical protein
MLTDVHTHFRKVQTKRIRFAIFFSLFMVPVTSFGGWFDFFKSDDKPETPSQSQISISQINQWREEVGLPPITGNFSVDSPMLTRECANGIRGSCQLIGQSQPSQPSLPMRPSISDPSIIPHSSVNTRRCDSVAQMRCQNTCRNEMETCKQRCPQPVDSSGGTHVVSSMTCAQNCISRCYNSCFNNCRLTHCP